MWHTRFSVTVVAGIVALLLCVGGCGKPPTSSESGPAATPAPPRPSAAQPTRPVGEQLKPAIDFSFTAFDGSTYSLAGLRGKPVVLNFWSSWCPHCATVAPYLEALYQQHKAEGLVVLGVAANESQDEQKALRKKSQSLKLTYPIGVSEATARAYDVSGIPDTYFITREGKIAASILGAKPELEFKAALEKII